MFADEETRGLRPARLVDQVHADLSRRLVSGVYAAGEVLSVRALKDEFEVSKQPVMDALRLLSADGLVEILPQSGCRVRAYTTEDAARFFRMFAAAESTIVATATELASDDGLAELHRLAESAAADAESAETGGGTIHARSDDYRRVNRRFHGRIHALAESPLLTGLSHRMWDTSDFLLATLGGTELFGRHERTRHAEHLAIATAMRRRDAEAASALMREHILANTALIAEEHARLVEPA